MDALKRCEGDANAAAEWLLSMPSYVEVNRPITSDRQVCSYPSHNVNIIEADLESNSTYVINEKPGKNDWLLCCAVVRF